MLLLFIFIGYDWLIHYIIYLSCSASVGRSIIFKPDHIRPGLNNEHQPVSAELAYDIYIFVSQRLMINIYYSRPGSADAEYTVFILYEAVTDGIIKLGWANPSHRILISSADAIAL